MEGLKKSVASIVQGAATLPAPTISPTLTPIPPNPIVELMKQMAQLTLLIQVNIQSNKTVSSGTASSSPTHTFPHHCI